jgi:hypothetical protein
LRLVREVYEHIYETVDVEGSPDIRASATAKATVAAFAASEGHAHPRYRYSTILWFALRFSVVDSDFAFI